MSPPSRPPRILQVIPALGTGGAEQTALDIGEALVAAGWTSFVASQGGRLLHQLEEGGSQHVHMPLDTKNPIRIWRNAALLARFIREHNIDIVHARSRAPAWSALIAARRTGRKFVTTYHGAYSQSNAFKGWYNSVMARADRVIANSKWTARLIAQRHPFAAPRIIAIARGTDFARFDPKAVKKARRNGLRDSWQCGDGDFVFLHLARLTGWKGQKIVIKAAAKLAADFPNMRCVLAGDAQGRSGYLESLQQLIEDHGLQGKVILPGHCDDPAGAMAAADAVVVASTDAEAFGRAAVEASALENPLIVTRLGAVEETVISPQDAPKGNFTGWKVEPGNAAEMADAMRTIMEMPARDRAKVGKRARAFVLDQFSLELMCRETLDVYRTLLGGDEMS